MTIKHSKNTYFPNNLFQSDLDNQDAVCSLGVGSKFTVGRKNGDISFPDPYKMETVLKGGGGGGTEYEISAPVLSHIFTNTNNTLSSGKLLGNRI